VDLIDITGDEDCSLFSISKMCKEEKAAEVISDQLMVGDMYLELNIWKKWRRREHLSKPSKFFSRLIDPRRNESDEA
jgi:hypothetical protein